MGGRGGRRRRGSTTAAIRFGHAKVASRGRGEREFDAAADGVDALGANANAIAKFPEPGGARLAPPRTRAGTAAAGSAEHSDDGVIVLAIDAAGLDGPFERVDGQQTLHKDVEEFDVAAVFLDRSDEAVVLVAEMLLHELCGLPTDEFALSVGGAAFGFGSFSGNFLEMLLAVERRLANGSLDVGGRLVFGVRDGPFEDAMNDEVGIAANGRSEVCVLVEAESEVAERIGGVASLFERAKHEVGNDAFFRPPGEFLDQALVVSWRDVDIGARKRDALLALAAVAAGFRAAGLGRGRNLAVADGDFALVEILDSEGVAESAGEFLEFEDLADLGLFVDAMKGLEAAASQVVGDGAVGREHEFFNDAVSEVAFAAADVGHALLFVKFDDRFGEIEVDGPVVFAASVEEKSESAHSAEVVTEVRVSFAHFRIALENLVDVGVGHALGRTDDAGNHGGGKQVSGGVEIHDRAHDQAFLAGLQGTDAVREGFGKHGNRAVDEVDGIAAEAGFAIEGRFRMNVVGDVGDVNLEQPPAVVAACDVNGIVEIAGGFAVNGDDRKLAKVLASGAVGFADGASDLIGVVNDIGRKRVGQVVLANDDFGVDAEIAGTAEDFNDASCGGGAAAAVANEFGVDDRAVEPRDVR